MEKEGADEGSGWHLLGLSNRRRVFFKYEKRIRELSPPDKVVDQNEWACAPLFREADGVVEGDQGRYRFVVATNFREKMMICRFLITLHQSHRTDPGERLNISVKSTILKWCPPLACRATPSSSNLP